MPKHGTPTHQELALRWFADGDGDGTGPWDVPRIARALGYHRGTIRRWLDLDGALGGGVLPTISRRRPHVDRHKLSAAARNTLVNIMRADPQLFYWEAHLRLWSMTGESCSVATVARLCKAAGFDDKVATTKSIRQDPQTMRLHAEARRLYHPRQFLFVDETHSVSKDMRRRRGKAQHGKRCVVPLTQRLGQSFTTLAAMDATGIVDHDTKELSSRPTADKPAAVDFELFMAMVRATILPHLQPADARQLARSVLIIDNCSLHHDGLDQLREIVEGVYGAVLLYTPQYCPRANAIEAAFSLMNYNIALDESFARASPKLAIERALNMIGPREASHFVERSRKDVEKWLRLVV